jgi:hypothetical protein
MVRAGVLEVAYYQAGPANGGPSSPGPVSGAPNLPAGFTDTFTSRYIDTGELRLHAVIGGEGPPRSSASVATWTCRGPPFPAKG